MAPACLAPRSGRGRRFHPAPRRDRPQARGIGLAGGVAMTDGRTRTVPYRATPGGRLGRVTRTTSRPPPRTRPSTRPRAVSPPVTRWPAPAPPSAAREPRPGETPRRCGPVCSGPIPGPSSDTHSTRCPPAASPFRADANVPPRELYFTPFPTRFCSTTASSSRSDFTVMPASTSTARRTPFLRLPRRTVRRPSMPRHATLPGRTSSAAGLAAVVHGPASASCRPPYP